ncbi:hypothetical protein [Pseudomonas oryzihabitans]|uniref:hypothetical protein n=1 Tax=Pseudomonas oryzihabitans TaxID=47885 RepID=UPI0028617909|nr:hypothetical protein [Pseudomonas psychrotolerans]MDR6679050.1 hypothetical protein [Pseudomonas psychrotolerans]
MDFNQRLAALRQRRAIAQPLNEKTAYDSVTASLSKSLNASLEKFESIQKPEGIKYVAGSMAPVSKRGTEISISEGKRVADSLIKSLEKEGEFTESVLQGSVALDIHIKGASDVDMLIIEKKNLRVEYPKVSPDSYITSSDSRSLLEIIKDIRKKSETILQKNFPATTVSGNDKSIAVTGGSLLVPVDIVPAVWFDSIAYQRTQDISERGIQIYSIADNAFIKNFPFKHIHEVNKKDARYSGNLKCVVRLLKTLVSDMSDAKKKTAKGLSSYDLTALAFHMNERLSTPIYQRISLVIRIEEFFNFLISSDEYRNSLEVPNNTRKIFDAPERLTALLLLRDEIRELSKSIAKELQPWSSIIDTKILEQSFVPEEIFF